MSSKLLHMIQQGEHLKQDFKFCINDSRKIAKSLVAFANTHGGKLLVGVKDNGNIAGVKSDEEYYMVEAAASLYSNPQISFTTTQWVVDGKTVLEINIEPSHLKPHFAKDDSGKWIAYIRNKDENIVVNRVQVEVWKKEKSPKGIFISYSKDEKFLVDYLSNHPSITISKFIRLSQINRNKALNILSNFVFLNIIIINASKKTTSVGLNHNFDKKQLGKFQ